MPITFSVPVEADGVVYDRVAVHLAISPAWLADDLGPSVAMRLVPYRKTETGEIEKLEAQDKAITYSALVTRDPAFEGKVRELLDVVQEIITAKGV
jgi:hypothetical protein